MVQLCQNSQQEVKACTHIKMHRQATSYLKLHAWRCFQCFRCMPNSNTDKCSSSNTVIHAGCQTCVCVCVCVTRQLPWLCLAHARTFHFSWLASWKSNASCFQCIKSRKKFNIEDRLPKYREMHHFQGCMCVQIWLDLWGSDVWKYPIMTNVKDLLVGIWSALSYMNGS